MTSAILQFYLLVTFVVSTLNSKLHEDRIFFFMPLLMAPRLVPRKGPAYPVSFCWMTSIAVGRSSVTGTWKFLLVRLGRYPEHPQPPHSRPQNAHVHDVNNATLKLLLCSAMGKTRSYVIGHFPDFLKLRTQPSTPLSVCISAKTTPTFLKFI